MMELEHATLAYALTGSCIKAILWRRRRAGKAVGEVAGGQPQA